MKRLTILGSTGSIGTAALDVVARFPDLFRIVGLAAGRGGDRLERQIRRFTPVMASVSTFLVVISSGLVRDVYQRFIHPSADEAAMRRVTYLVMVTVGAVAMLANLRPVNYLQALIVLSGTGTGATFFVPALMAAYWRRATAPGVLAAMVSGAAAVLGLLVAGQFTSDPMVGEQTAFRSYYLLGLHPFLWGLAASAVSGVVVSGLTKPPPAAWVSRLFDAPSGGASGSSELPPFR
jgi:SSS family solute:Na+ symporter/sodium/pantothenate symporter